MSSFTELKGASTPVSFEEGLESIPGKWYVKDVTGPVELKVVDGQVCSDEGLIKIVGKPKKGLSSGFEMDVEMNGFPMKAEMKQKGNDKMLLFSNSGIWKKGSPP